MVLRLQGFTQSSKQFQCYSVISMLSTVYWRWNGIWTSYVWWPLLGVSRWNRIGSSYRARYCSFYIEHHLIYIESTLCRTWTEKQRLNGHDVNNGESNVWSHTEIAQPEQIANHESNPNSINKPKLTMLRVLYIISVSFWLLLNFLCIIYSFK